MKTLLTLFLVLFALVGLSQESIKRNYFTTNQNPQINFTNGTLLSTNIYVSNIFATNITVNNITNNFDITTNLTVVNEFRGRTTITTNLFVTNSTIQFLTNNFFYTTNVTEQFVTNQLSYITNLYGPFITNNQLYSTNIYVTNVTANFITNNTSYITNLYGPFITNNTLYSTNIYTTNLTANFITNNTLITTNLYVSNVFATNITVDVLTNNLFVTSNAYVTNLYVSNIFATNITLMEAIWDTNKWNGPTNDVSFKATYQKYVTSTDMEMTGLIDSSASNANTSVVLIDPGGATRTLYFPAQFTNYTSDGNNAYVIPKTNIALVTLFQYGNQNTNVVVRLFGPGTGTPAPVAQVWTNHFITGLGTSIIWDPTTTNTVEIGTAPNIFGMQLYSLYSAPTPDLTGAHLAFVEAGAESIRGDNFYYSNGAVPTNGEIAGVIGKAGGAVMTEYGIIGFASPALTDGRTNVGVLGMATRFGSSGTYSGGYFGVSEDDSVQPTHQDSALVAEVLNGLAFNVFTGLTNGVTVSKIDSNGLVTANGFTDKSFAANGVVTNDSTGLLHTTPTLPSTLLPTDLAYTDKNNAFTTASSNYVAMTVTTSTNQNQVTPDFSVPEQLMSTNAAFTFLAPVGVDTTKTTVQWTLVNVTNTTSSAVLITPPANCHAVGTWYCTNLTAIWFQCYAQKFTNGFAIPVF